MILELCGAIMVVRQQEAALIMKVMAMCRSGHEYCRHYLESGERSVRIRPRPEKASAHPETTSKNARIISLLSRLVGA